MNFNKRQCFDARYIIILLTILLAASMTLSGCLIGQTPVSSSQPSQTTPSTEPSRPAETSAVPTPEPTPEPTVLAPSQDAPVIALTFDDGPSLRDTGGLLDLLAAEEVAATFFVLGNQVESGRQALVKRAYDEGHEIGNHSYSHPILTKLELDEVRNELDKSSSIIEAITGARPTIMRPPTGAWNDDIAAICADMGMAIVNWSWQSCPEDWNHHDNPEHIAEHVINTAQNGHIILLHDTNQATIAAMPQMIAGLKERGFRFMTVSQMLRFMGDGQPEAGKVYSALTNP